MPPVLFTAEATRLRNADPAFQAKRKAGYDAARLRRKTQLVLTTFEGSKAISLPGLTDHLNVREICARATPGTLIEVLKLMRTAKAEETRLSAARLILAYAWGNPETTINANRTGDNAPSAMVNITLASPIPAKDVTPASLPVSYVAGPSQVVEVLGRK